MEQLPEFNQIEKEILGIISNSHVSTILNNLASHMGALFQVDACGIVSGNLEFTTNLQFGWWHSEKFTIGRQNQLKQLLVDCLLPESTITIKNQTSDFVFSKNVFKQNCSVKTSLNLVTSFQGKVNGAVVLLKSDPYEWTNSEKQLLKKVSESMAIAISQVELQHKTQTKSQYQNLLSRLSKEISHNSDLDLLFNLALSEIGQVLQVNRGKVLTLKYQDPLFTYRSRQKPIKATLQVAYCWPSQVEAADNWQNFSFKLADSVWCQKAFAQAPSALIVNGEANFPDLVEQSLPNQEATEKSSAILMIPLMGKSSSESQPALVLGFLVLERNDPYIWTPDEVELLNWISIQMSIAMIHHQTLTQVQSLVEERTAQLKWSLDVQAKLSEKMRQQIQQLRQLNELKDDFLNSMSHELKTPLTSMKMAIKMLRQPLPETMREKYLNILEQEWNREYNLIKDLLTLQQMESGELAFNPQELDFNYIAQQLTQSFSEKWHSNKGLTLVTHLSEPNLSFYSDSDSLHHILSELLLNAAKYSDPDTRISLSASSYQTLKGKEIEIAVANEGAGITSDELPYIFDKFRRGKGVTDRAVPGTGLGLALVKYLVEHLNGTITVSSESLENSDVFQTIFTVKLPQLKKS